ncbi:hypothetical protein N7462_001369 [Penicillium macrosclerotiorum]|uniref:uncharacterized protein n=1 Tax=Penicillium macrosclerotiorum TaxID=303699 RepID=UPI0025490688|nr:uncharacterized protein N7462_001369 [Penicillium macrosclerotiorum]KAJ5691946.1 hypothetical protein N7462_001369 [Penicillium macrosclerotiorum]
MASTPASLNFEILLATEEDCPSLAKVEAVANTDADKEKPERNISRILFGPPDDVSFRAKDLTEKLQSDRTVRLWKAVVTDEEGKKKIVGFAFWYLYTEPKPIPEWKDIEWPAGANSAGCNEFIRKVVETRIKHMSEMRFGFLQVLATLREYRGHGIGSALINQGLTEGASRGLNDFWLEASNDGHGLYKRFGFQDVEPISIDLEKYGGVGVSCLRAMRKLPN